MAKRLKSYRLICPHLFADQNWKCRVCHQFAASHPDANTSAVTTNSNVSRPEIPEPLGLELGRELKLTAEAKYELLCRSEEYLTLAQTLGSVLKRTAKRNRPVLRKGVLDT